MTLRRLTHCFGLACLLAAAVVPRCPAAEGKGLLHSLDFRERDVLAKIGITDETSDDMAIATAQNALTRHRDPEVRLTCAKALGRAKVKSAMDALAQALWDPKPEVRLEVVRGLGVMGDWRAIEPLSALLQKEPNWENRKAIILAFRAIEDRRAGPVTATVLVKDPDYRVRQEAAKTLTKLKDNRTSQQLIQALSDPIAGVRLNAAQALGAIKERRALDKLVELLEQDENGDVRAMGALALGQIGSKQALTPLIAGLKHPYVKVRQRCIGALLAIGSSRALNPLREVAANDPDPRVRKAAQDTIRKIKEK